MQLYSDWTIDTTYSFDTTAPAILPTKYTQVKLLGIFTFEVIKILEGANAYAMWRRIYPSLNGVPDDPNAVTWLHFASSNGEKFSLANPWILDSTVTPVNFAQQRIILTQTNEAQVAKITAFLNAIQAKFTSERISP